MTEQALTHPLQPFFKLAQNNVAVLTRFTFSPEIMSQMARNTASMFQGGKPEADDGARASAFSEMTQGLVDNYTQFLGELMRSGSNLFLQGQAFALRQTQDAAQASTDVAEEAADEAPAPRSGKARR